ncbi:rod shape-determining protein MreD [Marinimicrobium sp. ABcell2]|uniref:rod shape-determining protein MreD n=1 Tax=Marinimicrobium sp. ABcell2 TaxID=3069751 RepID=UPI0027B7EB70|nr:rod shape-determining protein MreD [Marinimicrobium sp. ABcell2]MDQ2075119.1 rod shape-determining protein MreD [Marinimicrobium sp. ABcell2]
MFGSADRWVVIGAVLVALLLAVYPLPLDWRWGRPAFLLLLVIYWSLIVPGRTSLTLVWCLGLVQDLITGTPLGQHALGMVIVTYICLQSYQRVCNYGLWQQACWVFVLVGISQLTANWVYTMSGGNAPGLYFLLPAFTSALLWPFCYRLLEHLRHRFAVS